MAPSPKSRDTTASLVLRRTDYSPGESKSSSEWVCPARDSSPNLPVVREAPRVEKQASARGLGEPAVADLKVDLSPPLIFYWDRNVVPEDLVTDPVGLSFA